MLASGFSRKQVSLPEIDDLKFLSELSRSLVDKVHPKKVAGQVVEALCQKLQAKVCALVVELDNLGLVSSAVDRRGNRIDEFLRKERFRHWIKPLPPQVSFWTVEKDEFLLSASDYELEYVSPIHINSEVKGALIVGFESKEDFTEIKAILIDTTVQITTVSLNLSAHYVNAIDFSLSQVKEESRNFIESILDALPVSLYVVDRDYRIVAWNKNREMGLQGVPKEEVIGRKIFEVLNRYPERELWLELERVFRTGKIQRREQKTVDAEGNTKYWLISKVPMRDQKTGEITHVITIGEDVTARIEAIHAIARAEKLAAVGRLAAGVVHEINNPLATIAACAESLENRLKEGAFRDPTEAEDLCEYLSLIRSEAFRCKVITNNLLDFSRVKPANRMPIDVNLVVRASARLLEHQKRSEKISIILDLQDELPLINADEGQIQQAVIALATNAIDAMPKGGTLTFRTFSDSDRVEIEVRDTGCGIPPDDLPKIFEPFFTTKEVGKGTGLGLAVCYGIVTEHQGRLTVRSKPGEGSSFTMSFPAYKNLADE
ncbi:MAG: ATP-binding protein [Pyrinomonadaceae bacterium]|nr:ATP-binding protein [Pyrinomonadaceae bacterium]MCX7639434.1 ATP-binding protein [Pyrinomonadaceae bacterium]MDW8304516.1 ATP-binding protein [Acidobacteriota bacterium]